MVVYLKYYVLLKVKYKLLYNKMNNTKFFVFNKIDNILNVVVIKIIILI